MSSKIEELLTQFNGTTFSSNEDATEHIRLAIKRLMEEFVEIMDEESWRLQVDTDNSKDVMKAIRSSSDNYNDFRNIIAKKYI